MHLSHCAWASLSSLITANTSGFSLYTWCEGDCARECQCTVSWEYGVTWGNKPHSRWATDRKSHREALSPCLFDNDVGPYIVWGPQVSGRLWDVSLHSFTMPLTRVAILSRWSTPIMHCNIVKLCFGATLDLGLGLKTLNLKINHHYENSAILARFCYNMEWGINVWKYNVCSYVIFVARHCKYVWCRGSSPRPMLIQ